MAPPAWEGKDQDRQGLREGRELEDETNRAGRQREGGLSQVEAKRQGRERGQFEAIRGSKIEAIGKRRCTGDALIWWSQISSRKLLTHVSGYKSAA
jgi:hypothetical protein